MGKIVKVPRKGGTPSKAESQRAHVASINKGHKEEVKLTPRNKSKLVK